MIKTKYEIGDTVWIHGLSRENKLTKGKIIEFVDLSSKGYHGIHYIVAVSTAIEDLLEIRTWETISQDAEGPVGAFRDLEPSVDVIHKKLKHVGYTHTDEHDLIIDEPTPEQIHEAVERSIKSQRHDDMIQKPKRRFYNKKRKP